MGRPSKEWKLKVVNGVSVQVWFQGRYVGSYPLRKLYELACQNRQKRITGVSA